MSVLLASGLIAWVSFTSLSMLGWAGAAMIPVILHLLRRRRKSSVPWAAMRLLRQVIEQESRRATFQQLLLLLLRVAVLLVLALALARPFLTSSTGASETTAARPSKLWIIVVDTSYSMGYRSGELTRIERARQRVSRLIRESSVGDAFALIALDQPARAIVGRPTFDSEGVSTEVQRLTENARGCDPASALAIAGNIAADARNNPELPQDIEIIILTDFGVDAWQSAIDGPAAAVLKRLDQLYSVTLESMVETKPVNVAIESVQTSSSRTTVGNPFAVEVVVASYGEAANGLPVQLEMDGQIVATEQIDILADERTVLNLSATPRQPGISILSVVTPADNLPIDNRIDLAFEVRQGYRILIVDSNPEPQNAWQLALRPVQPESWQGRSALLRVVSELNWLNMSTRDWDVIILNDLSLTSASTVERLMRFVQSGGSAIFALGKNFSSSSAGSGDAVKDIDTQREQLLGFRVTQSSQAGDWTVDPLDYASPVINIFEGFPNSGLLTTPIFRLWRIEPRDPSLEVDLATTAGDPLIVRRRLGRGSVASLLSAPEDGRSSDGRQSWNAMTTWPSFLPLAQQLIQVLLDADAPQLNFIAGQPLSGSLRKLDLQQSITLIRPDQTEVQISGEPGDGTEQSSWRYDSTDQRGIYRANGPNDQTQIFAVNIDPIQSSLQSIEPQAIDAVGDAKIRADVAVGASQLAPRDRFSRSLLFSLGVLLVAESLMARALGRRVG